MKNVLVVYKKSVYELYSASPDKALQEFMTNGSEDVQRMKRSHDAQQRSLEVIVQKLEHAGAHYEKIYRAELSAEKTAGRELVISVGGDGTFLEVSHYVNDTPILGVNSDPNASVGFYCVANVANLGSMIANFDSLPKTELNRMQLTLDGKIVQELVLNDILIAHINPAAMTRYTITAAMETTEVKSSGLLVCTASGSTAWMYQEGGAVMPLSSKELQYFSRGVRGEKFRFASELRVDSKTRQGKLYIDGAHLTCDFTLGSSVDIKAGSPLTVIGDLQVKRVAYAA